MKKLFRNPFFQFLSVVILIFLYSSVLGQPLESVIDELVVSSPAASPSPIPNPSVFGTSTATNSAVVSEVIDGDTIRLSSGETLRYIGIDTPETRHPQRGKECFGSEASRRNEELVLGKSVRLEKDVREIDRYGRLLRYVWIDDLLINEVLVQEGFAHSSAYPPDVKYQDRFDQAERMARESNAGLWGICVSP